MKQCHVWRIQDVLIWLIYRVLMETKWLKCGQYSSSPCFGSQSVRRCYLYWVETQSLAFVLKSSQHMETPREARKHHGCVCEGGLRYSDLVGGRGTCTCSQIQLECECVSSTVGLAVSIGRKGGNGFIQHLRPVLIYRHLLSYPVDLSKHTGQITAWKEMPTHPTRTSLSLLFVSGSNQYKYTHLFSRRKLPARYTALIGTRRY